MTRSVKTRAVLAVLSISLGVTARPDEPEGREIPPAFAPFEYLVGRWHGQAMPKDAARSFRGWPEAHAWAWIFAGGKPTGLSLSIEGGKVLAGGKLSFDPARKRYRLEGTAAKPGAGAIAFEGGLDASGKTLVLDQVAPAKGAPEGATRLSIRPNSNYIRYTMFVDRKEPGAAQFRRTTEVGLTKEGESLAGGSSASERPKCIVTGGAAAMTISYQGQTFPICCSGCRDEFNENPEKYIKKASLMARTRAAKADSGSSSPARVSRYEDAFSGDVAEMPATKGGRPAPSRPAPGAGKRAEAPDAEGPAAPAKEGAGSKSSASTPATRAAGLLRIGQNLEKSGKSEPALATYRRIVKDYPETPAARTARQRIKALETP